MKARIKRPAGPANATDMMPEPDVADALRETDELVALMRAGGSDPFVEFSRILDGSAPSLRAYIDKSAASAAGYAVVRYEMHEGLKARLAALRARNLHLGDIKKAP